MRLTRRGLVWGLGAAALLFGPGLYELVRLHVRQRALDRQLAALAGQQAALEEERERFASDPVYVEGLIRTTFKLARKGELVLPIDDEPR